MNARLIIRVTAPTVAVSLALLALGAMAAWYVQRLQSDSLQMLVENVASVRAAEEVEIGAREVQSQLNKFLRSGDRKHLGSVPTISKEVDRWLREADRLSTTPREDQLVASAKLGYERFFDEFERLSQELGTTDAREDVEQLVDEFLSREVLEPIHQYLDFNEEMMAQTSTQNQLITNRMALVLLLLGFSGAVAGLLAGFGIARGINRSIVQLTVPIRDAAGRLNQVVGPITVSTARGLEDLAAELHTMAEHVGAVVERLQKSQSEVLRAEQLAALGQLAAGLAHELRNPLMSVKLLAQSASERYQSGTLRARDLTTLEEVAIRLEHSVQTILDFARPPRLEKSRFQPSSVIEQTVELVAVRALQQGVRIELLQTTVKAEIEADVVQFRQVLLNLFLNSLDATPGGGIIRVRVTADELDANRSGKILRIAVSDTGCGLPERLGDRIFEPFISTKETGVGLGLSISKRITEAHGGTITAGNCDEGGAIFTISLPCVENGEALTVPGDQDTVLSASRG